MSLDTPWFQKQIDKLNQNISNLQEQQMNIGVDQLSVWAGFHLSSLIGRKEVFIESLQEMKAHDGVTTKESLVTHHETIAHILRADIEDPRRENIYVHPMIKQQNQQAANDNNNVLSRPPANYWEGYALGMHEGKANAYRDMMEELADQVLATLDPPQ